MVLMVLDHARFYFSSHAGYPGDLTTTTPGQFFTWWITHFCAPLFVLLAGTGAYLRAARGTPKREVAWYLVTRGLLLVALDVTLVQLSMWFAYDVRHIGTNVLWAIGWSMMGLAGMIFFRAGTVAVVGLAIVFLHNAFDDVQAVELGRLGPLWSFLKEGGTLNLSFGTELYVYWPVLPWFGVICCGYAMGELYRLPVDFRRVMLLGLGANLTVIFLVLRLVAIYGDPAPWSSQDDAVRTFMSFLNCTKHPASLCYLLMTLGPSLILLGWLERDVQPAWRWLTVFGCVPLFFYLVQWPLLHFMAVVLALVRGQPTGWLFSLGEAATGRGVGWQSEFGFSLPVVYLLWLAALCVLYPICRWYAGVKFLRRPRWASYF